MKHPLRFLPLCVALPLPVMGDETLTLVEPAPGAGEATWERFNDWSLGDVLFPNLHLHGVGGFSTGEPDELGYGGHDPKREAFSAQAIEPGVSFRTQYVEGFANYLWFQDHEGDWDGELEEAFGKIVNIPGGLELKGGRFLSRFGSLNDRHLHGWDFVDSELANSRFLGEDGLLVEGGEVSWTLPLGRDPSFVSIATLGFGMVPEHSHAHGHDDEDHEDEHGEDHGEEHEDEDEHGHDDHAGALFDGEEGYLSDDALTARLMGRYRFDDFHSVTAGVSWAGGRNGFDRDTAIYGLDVEYLWRERGLEPGGRAFRWRNELLWRSVEAFSEHEEEDGSIETHLGTYEETGVHSHFIYTWNDHLDTGVRLAWLEGVDAFGQDGRFRISPAVTWWIDSGRRVSLRSQYNFDSIEGGEDEHSVWFQLSMALGSNEEVR